MKQKIVGVYDMGLEQVQIVLREGVGGEFYMSPDKGAIPRIKIGVDSDGWSRVVITFLHEAFEMEMTRTKCRFNPSPDFGRDHSSYLFLMNHPDFSEICARVGELAAAALPDLSRAFTAWNKKPKAKKRKR